MSREIYISLKQLLSAIQGELRESFPASYWIKAEVAGVRRKGNHVYFDLIELERGAKVAQIKACAFWGEGTDAIFSFEKTTGQRFTEGIKIGARVTVNYHPVYGLSLVLCEIDAQLTLGGIELQRQQTLDKLVAEYPQTIQFSNGSYITPNKLLPLPKVVQRIALITSAGSDAYNDFIHCLDTNDYRYRFRVDTYNVLVHGNGAVASLLNAFSEIRNSGINYDVVILTRGGGAPADFLPFDNYSLALELAQFPIPVITGIGHHMNQGICDFFARIHTKTPSIAAQFLIDHNQTFERNVQRISSAVLQAGVSMLSSRLISFGELKRGFSSLATSILREKGLSLNTLRANIITKIDQGFVQAQQQLNNTQFHINRESRSVLYRYQKSLAEKTFGVDFIPSQLLRTEKQKIGALQRQVLSRLPRLLSAEHKELNRLKDNVQNLSPGSILKRGFAILKKDGKILSEPAAIQKGDVIQIIHQETVIETEVKDKGEHHGEFDL